MTGGSTVDNVTTNYSYDADGNMTSKEQGGRSVSYAYNSDDKLTSVSRNNTVYNYTYDVWGRPVATKVGSQALETASYNTNGTLSSKTYGNGNVENYTYNSYGQVKKISLPGLGSYSFRYDSKGTKLFDSDSVNSQKTYYYYDEEGRSTGEHVSSSAQSNTYTNDIYDTKIVYNDDGEVIKTSVASSTVKFENSYTYTETETGSQASSSFTNNRGVVAVYDGDSQLSQRTITTDTPFVQTYTYNDDSLITSETRGSDTYTYTYDNSDRITEIKKNNVLTQSYSYNSFGELVRENNLDRNKTVIYNYDNGGNIKKREIYSYTTGDLSAATAQQTINYGYDSVWKDKLTSYNGQTITSDAIGNPLTYRDSMSFTWFGRQLQTANIGGTSISYKYDSDGNRSYKKVGNTVSEYQYLGNKLVYEKKGTTEWAFRYDSNGNLAALTRKTADGASHTYYAVCNSRGDVEELRNSSGAIVARYIYDTWGNTIKVVDKDGVQLTNSNLIALQNPIRYRGYYFDSETGFYYISSRYYDPEIGRFINADTTDVLTASRTTLTDKNLYAYCDNNPVIRRDTTGAFWESALDVISLVSSIVEVATNPHDPWAWVGLAGDVADVLIPFVGGIGETTRAIKVASKTTGFIDTATDVKKGWKVGDDITNLTKAGNVPSWSTVRQRFWKNEAHFHPERYKQDLARMKKGRAPIGADGYSMELHHPFGRAGENFFNFEPVTQTQHRWIHYGA